MSPFSPIGPFLKRKRIFILIYLKVSFLNYIPVNPISPGFPGNPGRPLGPFGPGGPGFDSNPLKNIFIS